MVAVALLLAPPALTAQRGTPAPNDYADGANWLCRPGRDDACAVDMRATVVHADGTTAMEDWAAEPNAPIDCFYVYPTVSTDSTPNSDMSPDAAELRVVHQQFARFASVCRPYAPSYRQVTLAGLRTMMAGRAAGGLSQGLGYDDVRDAFRYYLEHDNDGRGFVLIGHSQGSYVLTQLIRQEIDGRPVQERLVSALLLGATVPVADGAFGSIRLCRAESQTGCLISYVSFRSTSPPPESTRFGRTTEPGLVAACTNPAALAGGRADVHAYLSGGGTSIVGQRGVEPWASHVEVETPFVSVPGLLTAECKTNENATYLDVTVNGDPSDPRVDNISGDLTPDWGLHLIDVNLGMGDLVRIVGAQARTWERRRSP
jgi:hypothetical protein